MTTHTPAIPGERARRPARSLVRRDAVVALIALGLTLLVQATDHSAGRRSLDVPSVLLALVACLPLLDHRRRPLAVFVLTSAASATLNGLGYALGPPFGPTAALFYLASDGRTSGRLAKTAAIVIGMTAIHLATTAISEPGFPAIAVLGAIVLWGGAWIVGDQISQRRRRHAELVERAERAERDTARERRLAVAEERTRIARDLHDSVAHAINVILIQAGSARLLQDRDPPTVRGALETIEDVARETISDIDRLVHTLRDGERPPDRDVEPPAGLAAAQMLAERHRAAGLAVEITTEGPPRRLAPVLDQAAYRIVQESLTNAARHGSGPAGVSIRYGESALELVTSNPVAPGRPERADSGHGLQGMRERAALLGGSLDAGRQATSFTVHARLPYPPQTR